MQLGKNVAYKHIKMLFAFFTCLVMVQDSTEGRLHLHGIDLLDKFDAGDIIMMDPCLWYSVMGCARKLERKVLVFTV